MYVSVGVLSLPTFLLPHLSVTQEYLKIEITFIREMPSSADLSCLSLTMEEVERLKIGILSYLEYL